MNHDEAVDILLYGDEAVLAPHDAGLAAENFSRQRHNFQKF